MFFLESAVGPADLVFSASDLVGASECEYRTLRILDEKLGRTATPEFAADHMLARAGELGDAHERKVLEALIGEHGPWDPQAGTGVYRVERPATMAPAPLRERHDETWRALEAGADVVFQATFFDGEFLGFADFIVRQPDGSHAVWDTKLARHAKVGALLQLAAYGEQLGKAGFAAHPDLTLVLGDMSRSVHPLPDLLPVFRERRQRFRALTASHRAGAAPVEWGQDGLAHCGRCDYCAEQVSLSRDLLLVSGMSMARRAKLREAGVRTIDDLALLPEAAATGPLARLRDQARMQTGRETPDGSCTYQGTDGRQRTVSYRLLPGGTIGKLPPASPGDIFFDFEGDPLWQDPHGGWGLEYLFGVVEADGPQPVFRPFWAHSRGGEKRAFLDFLDYVEKRRATWPDLHVYHYAPYEKSALRHLASAHTAGEDTIDAWLREGLLVDLYDTVRHSLRISESSYSIKKLEPLYMGGTPRSGDVVDAGASVVAYADYCAARDAGEAEKAAAALQAIAAYNEYDCLSTLRLRDWLVGLVPAGPAPQAPRQGVLEPDGGPEVPQEEPSPEELRLRAFLEALPADRDLTADERAVAMVAAATGYHRREEKQFWWGHYDRLDKPVDEWAETRNVFVVEEAEVLDDWAKSTPRARTETRTVRLRGTMPPGSDFRPGTTWFRMFGGSLPEGIEPSRGSALGRGGMFSTEVLEAELDEENGGAVLTIAEKSSGKVEPYPHLPIVLAPDQPIRTTPIREALAELARTVGGTLPALPRHPGLEILRKAAPRFRTLQAPPAVGPDGHGQLDYIGAITEAVADLDHSYLAVQGPPGTGKTHVGSHVIANLVARGWKVGVVGQSHAVVENMLAAAVEKAGVDPERVGKKPKDPAAQKDGARVPWKVTGDKALAGLLEGPEGALVGGTAWTMTGKNIPAGALDLLVVDEAGQYSLANTLAVSRAARRLLLLGDPQQLPQVTQGTHPEPVDESALGWLSAGHATLPPELGYFLADSWRMHPALCEAVSRLSYDGQLKSAPAAALRHLEREPAGVETVCVEHTGNATSSTEEAGEVLRQVRRHLGLAWDDGRGSGARGLGQEDILVVAAYNAQVNVVRDVLEAAGLSGVRVGTVDKFQGQEAPVVIVTMACSNAAEAPRGMEFLLNRNRINVAVSRGQWRAVIVRSPELTSHMPNRPAALAELGAFVGLCSGGA
ncbi:ATPase [Zafaria cholistanensis]|uniref:ATPase n=1 Tax=Zafaria cholistanensis TaxID=1682741 RepID=A0A5A7NSD1_9MICC|nr:TM0106 family RecB-like putative nuclease [Zafaria cholistanensis]GER23629.1 ATPase [Zafaria cholistanensis]